MESLHSDRYGDVINSIVKIDVCIKQEGGVAIKHLFCESSPIKILVVGLGQFFKKMAYGTLSLTLSLSF